jgi:hypothetical protein
MRDEFLEIKPAVGIPLFDKPLQGPDDIRMQSFHRPPVLYGGIGHVIAVLKEFYTIKHNLETFRPSGYLRQLLVYLKQAEHRRERVHQRQVGHDGVFHMLLKVLTKSAEYFFDFTGKGKDYRIQIFTGRHF